MTIAEIKKALECCHTMAVECDECPIHNRKGDWTDGKDCDDVLHDEILKVWDNMVQVVRCKDCEYADDFDENGICYCLRHNIYFTKTDYCSDGEVATVKDEDSKDSGDVKDVLQQESCYRTDLSCNSAKNHTIEIIP